MTSVGVLQIGIFLGLVLVCAKPLGAYMARVFEGQRTFMHPVLRWVELLTYKVAGIREDVEQPWTQYTAALLSFSIFGFLLTYLLQRAQGILPFNPQHFGAGNVTPDLAFNTATSFVTNTNWQAYSGESTLSYFVQMAALTVQNFASAEAIARSQLATSWQPAAVATPCTAAMTGCGKPTIACMTLLQVSMIC